MSSLGKNGVHFKGAVTRAELARSAGLVSVCRDLGTFVKRNKNHLRDYQDNRASPEIPPNRAEIFSCNRVCRVSSAQ